MDQRPLCPRACLHSECSARRRAALKPAVTLEPKGQGLAQASVPGASTDQPVLRRGRGVGRRFTKATAVGAAVARAQCLAPEKRQAIASLVSLPPVGEFIAAMLANCALRNFEGVARILAGLGDDKVLDQIDASKMTPVRRPRRPSPTAADRAQAAAAWLAGPAWTIVDPDPNPSPTEGAP